MDKGIWKVVEAWLCVKCRYEMREDYVIRSLGPVQRRKCDRCGRNEFVSKCKYTMGAAGLKKARRLDG